MRGSARCGWGLLAAVLCLHFPPQAAYPDANGNELVCEAGWYATNQNSFTNVFYCAFCSEKTCAAGEYYECTDRYGPRCRACTTCGVGTYASTPCGGSQNAVCTACPACPAGSYVSRACGGSQVTLCTACTICYPGAFVSAECQANGVVTQNRQCQACVSPLSSSAQNSAYCNSCIAGYYRPAGGVCQQCVATRAWVDDCASKAGYIVCDGVNPYGCVSCTGSGQNGKAYCGVGKQASKSCSVPVYGAEMGADAVCVDCPVGYNNMNAALFCSPCPTGFYVTTTGAQYCVSCNNKPGPNSVYTSWNGTVAGSNKCPWACNSGYYVSSVSTTGGCAACSTLPAQIRGVVWIAWPGPTTLGQCQLVCDAGFAPVGTGQPLSCQACPTGMYKPAAGNDPCTLCTNAQAVGNSYYLASTTFSRLENACPW